MGENIWGGGERGRDREKERGRGKERERQPKRGRAREGEGESQTGSMLRAELNTGSRSRDQELDDQPTEPLRCPQNRSF